MQKPRRRVLETIYTPTPNSITIKNERVVAEATLFLPGPLPCAEKDRMGWVESNGKQDSGPLWEDERRRGRSCQRTNGEKHSTDGYLGGYLGLGTPALQTNYWMARPMPCTYLRQHS